MVQIQKFFNYKCIIYSSCYLDNNLYIRHCEKGAFLPDEAVSTSKSDRNDIQVATWINYHLL
jgi:hypothetical protein